MNVKELRKILKCYPKDFEVRFPNLYALEESTSCLSVNIDCVEHIREYDVLILGDKSSCDKLLDNNQTYEYNFSFKEQLLKELEWNEEQKNGKST
jgi:hypothetical protein